jgi:hypothetical protein
MMFLWRPLMKGKNLITGLLMLTLILTSISLESNGLTATNDVITENDPSGDTENYLIDDSFRDSVDLVKFEVDQSSDPVLFSLKVVGKIIIENATVTIYYSMLLDQTGNGQSDCDITFTSTAGMSLGGGGESSFGDGYFFLDGEGNGTDTLTFSVSRSNLGIDSNPIVDISAEASVVAQNWGSATDYLNKDFEGPSAGDDDDDNDGDNDGMPDAWETQHGLDTSIDDSQGDKDGDGYTNEQEFMAGTAPDDMNDNPGTSTDDDDDDEEIPDPIKEIPTDTSISVSIDEIEYSLDKGESNFELEQKTKGTTSGEVHHCSITYVEYYDDGTYETDEWQVGPDIQERFSLFGMTIEYYFKGTGSGGKNDWSQWELYAYAKAPNSEYDEYIGEDEGAGDGDERTLTEAYVVVRAYSDASETKWNQESKELTDLYEKVIEGEDFSGTLSLVSDDNGDDKKTPGFEIYLVFASVSILGLMMIIRRRREFL